DLVLDIAGVVDRLVRGDVQVRAGVVAVDVLIVHLVEAEVVVPVAPDRDTAKGLERKLVVAGDPAFGEALNKVLRAVLVGIETCERGTGDVDEAAGLLLELGPELELVDAELRGG